MSIYIYILIKNSSVEELNDLFYNSGSMIQIHRPAVKLYLFFCSNKSLEPQSRLKPGKTLNKLIS